jgi:hypothetical protein
MREIGTGSILRWMVHPSALARLEYVDGDWPWEHPPHENQVITRQFLVHPISKYPVPVRVVRVLRLDKEIPIVFAILVRPAG